MSDTLPDAYNPQSSIPQQTPSAPLLTPEQIAQILAALQVQEKPVNIKRAVPLREEKATPSKWPEWDGKSEHYNSYIELLAAKIDVDWEKLGGHKAVCIDMMNSIPLTLRNRVSQWFSTGGPDGDWNYELFISHFNDNFGDKTAARTAGDRLTRIRQGEHQIFADFLNDFEYMLAQAKGLKWEGRVKVNQLSASLNKRLSDYLVAVNTSDDDYLLFVNQERRVANKLEAKEDFLPKRGPRQTKTWYISKSGTAPQLSHTESFTSPTSNPNTMTTVLDYEGDTPMVGVNGISIAALTTLINKINSQGQLKERNKDQKPPAPWRPQEEFAALRAAGKCTRCAGKGHWFKKCPHYTWAKRPVNVNSTVTMSSKNFSRPKQNLPKHNFNDNPMYNDDNGEEKDNDDYKFLSGKE